MKRSLHRRYGLSSGGPRAYAVGDVVVLPKGHRVGMGKLREEVRARIDQLQTASDGSTFYGVEWSDPRTGKRRTTWWAP
jgi:hypothetical protein